MGKEPEKTFLRRRQTNDWWVYKSCAASLIIREIQTKTTMGYCLIHVRLAIIKKTSGNKCFRGYEEKWTLTHWWCEYKLIDEAIICKTVLWFLKKLKIELSYSPTTSALDIYPKDLTSVSQRGIRTPMFIIALLIVTKIRKQPMCPKMDEWIMKMWYIYAMESYSTIKINLWQHQQTMRALN